MNNDFIPVFCNGKSENLEESLKVQEALGECLRDLLSILKTRGWHIILSCQLFQR